MFLLYIVFVFFCLTVYCWTAKTLGEDVTVGLMCMFLVLGAIPVVNLLMLVGALIYITDATKFWDKKLF